jgi:hypothetical protein
MTYHGFMSSTQMFQKLQEAWGMIVKHNAALEDRVKDQAELLFVVLVEKWVEISFFDFDTALLQGVSQWLGSLRTNRQSTQKRMQAALQRQIEGKKGDQRMEALSENVSLPANLFISTFALSSINELELARQITMASSHYYYLITPKELLDCAWSKSSIRHRAPNIVALTHKFNVLGDWVVFEILHRPTIDARIEAMSFFAKLATELWQMGNFFDGLSVASSLNSNAIYRLKNHKAMLHPKVAEPLQGIIDASKGDNSFAELVQLHANAQKRGAALPFIGVYLGQLTFSYEGNPDYIDGLVNFSKCVLIFKIVDRILSFQTKQFNFVVIDQIQEKLRALPKLDESDLFAKSLQVEKNKMDPADFRAQLEAERESR